MARMSDDRTAFEELARHLAPGVACTLAHYLYLPRREDATAAGAALRARGFRTEERLGANGVNWLVVARCEVVPSLEGIAAARTLMEQLVEPKGGEYDGWEADLINHG
jgi:hypothetical protein